MGGEGRKGRGGEDGKWDGVGGRAEKLEIVVFLPEFFHLEHDCFFVFFRHQISHFRFHTLLFLYIQNKNNEHP